MKSKLPEFLDSYVIISLSKKDFSARDKQRSPSWDFSDLGITRQETSYENKKTGLFSLVSAIITRATFLNDGSYIVKNLTTFEEK